MKPKKTPPAETELLDAVLRLLDREGPAAARRYLEANQQSVESENRVQIENFRYCLAAACGDREAALSILRGAVAGRGYWYRPAVFADADLRILWDDPEFCALKALSGQRYQNVRNRLRPECTWKGKTSDSILLALHGNQENLENARAQWDFLRGAGIQTEYFQSGEPDSSGIFRWETDGPGAAQLAALLRELPWTRYRERTLAGFSAGCNVIARAVSEHAVRCSRVIFQSPWLPSFEAGGFSSLCAPLSGARALIVCGGEDGDCLPGARRLAEALQSGGVPCELREIPDLGHAFPSRFPQLVLPWLDAPAGANG